MQAGIDPAAKNTYRMHSRKVKDMAIAFLQF